MPYGYPNVSQPMYGLGSYSRIIGAGLVSCPRTKIAGSTRVYNYLKNTKGYDFAIKYFNDASFGKYRINSRQSGLILNSIQRAYY
jgi:hypothetical protein